MPWDFALILVVLGIVVPWHGATRFRALLRLEQITTADRLSLYASTIAFQWVAAAIVAWRGAVRGLEARALALVVPNAPLVVAVTIALALFLAAGQYASLRRLAALPVERRGTLGQITARLFPHSTIELLAFSALAVTAGLCEEFLYRGFAFAVLSQFFGGSLIAGVLASSVLFAAAHAYQGRRGLRTTFTVGLVFAVTRAWTGSLLAVIVAHITTDLLAGLLGPRLLGARRASAYGAPPSAAE